MAIGGIDVGSTGSKITIYDENGQRLHTGYRAYPISRDMGMHELDARHIRDSVLALVKEAAQAVKGIRAIGVSAFGESFVLLDEKDEPLLPIMMYTDPRGGDEAKQLSEILGERRAGDLCGARPHSMYSLPKVMWIKKHRPELFARAKRLFLMEDYVTYLLTGECAIDYSEAARTMAFDIDRLTWCGEILAAAEVPEKLFSRIVPTGSIAGTVRKNLAVELGLDENVQIVACCHDQVAAAVGSGVLEDGMATDGAGTVQCMTPVFRSYRANGDLQKDNFVLIPFLKKGMFTTYAFLFTGGAVAQWYVEQILGGDYGELEAGMKDEPTGMLLLPHFAGAATPYMDSLSQGAIVGLTLERTRSDLYRAVMEGVCYEMALNREKLAAAGIDIRGLNATGGCARSRTWLQMKADVLDVEVRRMKEDNAGTVGGIMLTGVASGAYPDLKTASGVFTGVREVFAPRKDMHERYMEIYEKYRGLYQAVRPLITTRQEG